MKYISLVVILALVLLPVNVYAYCEVYNSGVGPGPVYGCPNNYYTFTCAKSHTGATWNSTGFSCGIWSQPAWSFTGTPGTVVYELDVTNGSSCKNVAIFVDFVNNSGSPYDWISANVTVTHNGSQTLSRTFFNHSGWDPAIACVRYYSGSFSAADGDTITVTYTGYNYYNDVMQISPPTIWD